MTVERCAVGQPPHVCCVGRPWDALNLAAQVAAWGEPLPQSVIDAAVRHGLDPHLLDEEVTCERGWESHDAGYDAVVAEVAAQMAVDR